MILTIAPFTQKGGFFIFSAGVSTRSALFLLCFASYILNFTFVPIDKTAVRCYNRLIYKPNMEEDMKKIILTLLLILALTCVFTACDLLPNGANKDCEHVWETVTTEPTCTSEGYEIKTCTVCKESVEIEIQKLEHDYDTTYINDEYHWYKCTVCNTESGKELHTLDDKGVCTVCDLPITPTPGVIYNLSDDKSYAMVVGYEGAATKVKIAEEYNGVPVKSIYNHAFENCSSLTSVVIPDSVTSIGTQAFYMCSSLTSVVIGNSVTSIGDIAFYWCTSLTSVVISNSVTSIGDLAFCNCSSLTSVVIPDSVTSIGNHAFAGCSSLTSIVIPDSVTSIGGAAFGDCTSLTKITVNADNDYYSSINGNLYSKDGKAFIQYACGKNDREFIISDSVTSIGDGAFSGCSNLTSIVIPDSITSIGYDAFSGCSGLTSVVIPDSVTSIGSYAFYYCSGLTSVVIPDSVTSIGDYAFWGCSSLSSIVIPDSVTSIGSFAFRECSGLTSVVIPDSVTSIGDFAFEGCSGLESVVIPDSVTSIGDGAFRECSSLSSVVIPESVTSIGNSTFSDCSSLTSVVIPGSVTSIGHRAFDGCHPSLYSEYEHGKYVGNEDNPYFALVGINSENMSTCTIHEDTKIIADGAFSDCRSLTSIVIPDSVISIGNWAFQNCSNLTSVVIPDSVTSIGNSTFSWCSRLKSVVIGDSVTSIGLYAFLDCSNLSQIIVDTGNNHYSSIDGNLYSKDATILIQYAIGKTDLEFCIPDSVTSIGDGAFYGCSNLTSVVIPDRVTSIGGYAFYDCDSLTSVVIPDSVTSIGNSAFNSCSRLTYVYYTGSKEEWAEIEIDSYNSYLTNANIHYNYVPEE